MLHAAASQEEDTYIAKQICGVAPHTRGHRANGQLVQGEFEDHTAWNTGISKALKWMHSHKECRSTDPLITTFQKKGESKRARED